MAEDVNSFEGLPTGQTDKRNTMMNRNKQPQPGVCSMSTMKRSLGAIAAFALVVALTAIGQAHAADAAAFALRDLRCESQSNPLGIDAAPPRLSWKLADARRGARQTAYRVICASSPEVLTKDNGDLWDSGKVVAEQSHLVEYGGKPLDQPADRRRAVSRRRAIQTRRLVWISRLRDGQIARLVPESRPTARETTHWISVLQTLHERLAVGSLGLARPRAHSNRSQPGETSGISIHH